MDVVSVKIEANHEKTRRLQLCVDKLETLEDIQKSS